jgi:hypothetical protein
MGVAHGQVDVKDTPKEAAEELSEIVTGGNENTRDGSLDTDVSINKRIPEDAGFTYRPETGTVTITDKDGNVVEEITVPKDENGGDKLPMTVQDGEGNIYRLEKGENGGNGLQATSIGKKENPLAPGSFDAARIDADRAAVTFSKGAGVYAFDEWRGGYGKNDKLRGYYDDSGNGYHAAWKFLPAGGSDKVSAVIDIKDKDILPENVIFSTPQGIRFDPVREGTRYELTLSAGRENDVQEIFALYPAENGGYLTLGKLNAVTYNRQRLAVTLVGVGTTIDKNIAEEVLKQVYGPVGVTFDLRLETFDYRGDLTDFLKDASGLLYNYNEKMRALIDAYKAAHPDTDAKTARIFLLDKSGDTNPDGMGFMPKGQRQGFVFRNGRDDTQLATTVAHELGHGRWRFAHTFDLNGLSGADLPDNLMNYTGGTHLAKWQWELISYPAWISNPFEGDEEGMLSKYLTKQLCVDAAIDKALRKN